MNFFPNARRESDPSFQSPKDYVFLCLLYAYFVMPNRSDPCDFQKSEEGMRCF